MKTTQRMIELANDSLLVSIDPCVRCGSHPCAQESGGECVLPVIRVARAPKVEQIDRHDDSPGYRKFLKHRLARLFRRMAKRDPEEAPVKVWFRGYSK